MKQVHPLRKFGLFFLTICVLGMLPKNSSADNTLPTLKDLSQLEIQAGPLISKNLSGAHLFMIEAIPVEAGSCHGSYSYLFRYVRFDSPNAGSGAVVFTPSGMGCQLKADWQTDIDSLGMGYYFFELNSLSISVSDALKTVQKKYSNFSFDGKFRFFQPLNPAYSNPLLLVSGLAGSNAVTFTVDEKTGALVDDTSN